MFLNACEAFAFLFVWLRRKIGHLTTKVYAVLTKKAISEKAKPACFMGINKVL